MIDFNQDEVIKKIQKQQNEIIKQNPKIVKVTCGCGKRLDIRQAFRCYFCGIYFCTQCASDHFGDTEEKRKARSIFNPKNQKVY